MPVGVHDLIVEVYAPENDFKKQDLHYSNKDKAKYLEFPAPLTVMAQKRVKVVVGDVDVPIAARSWNSGDFLTWMTFSHAYDNAYSSNMTLPKEGFSYEQSMPEKSFVNLETNTDIFSNVHSIKIRALPKGTAGKVVALQTVTKRHGVEMYRITLPLEWKDSPLGGDWSLAMPTSSFGVKAASYAAAQRGVEHPDYCWDSKSK
jgi:hypothetical protein